MTGKRKLAVGILTAMVAIGGVFLYFQTRVGATNYDWLQATWSGGADTVNFPRHGQDTPGLPKQNWTKFFSKDAQIDTSNNEIKITQTDANWTETDDASGFSAGTKSNTYSSGTGFLLKKNNGVACTTAQTTDYECTTGNCDADFSSGNYCHATASSCVYGSGASEAVDGWELCSGHSYYKSCANSVWGAQQNSPDTANDYCDAGGGTQSGYDLLATCANGASGGFTNPGCTSCSPYVAASTSSCKTTCASGSDCWSGYICSGGACVSPWLSGYCSIQVYYANVSSPTATYQHKTSQTSCVGPQCATGLDTAPYFFNYSLVADNGVDFSTGGYTARQACKDLGGRLPRMSELSCMYANRAALGIPSSNKYWSATEYSGGFYAWGVNFGSSGNAFYDLKTISNYVRCVR